MPNCPTPEFDISSCGNCGTVDYREERMYKTPSDIAITYKLIAEFGGIVTAMVTFTEDSGTRRESMCNFTRRRWETFQKIG